MYELVDAVNQQCTGINSGDLLVLTKFAELVAKPNEPRLRVSEKFLATITRMCVKTVQDHLKKLHKLGYLVALEDRAAKKPSDESTLYELRLPEGFDSDVISRRRGRYYGGEAIVLKKSGIDRNREDTFLTPVPNGVKDSDSTRITEKISTPLENPSKPLENPSEPLENSSTPLEKTSTINNIITKENNNTNTGGGGSLSDVPSVEEVLKLAAKVTGSVPGSFTELNIPADRTPDICEIIREFENTLNEKRDDIKNPVGYLRTMISRGLEQGIRAVVGQKTDDIVDTAKELSEQARIEGMTDEQGEHEFEHFFNPQKAFSSCWNTLADKLNFRELIHDGQRHDALRKSYHMLQPLRDRPQLFGKFYFLVRRYYKEKPNFADFLEDVIRWFAYQYECADLPPQPDPFHSKPA